MLLKIKHTTKYSYSQPQRMVVQSHRLYPSRGNMQTVVRWDVAVEGARFGDYFEDGAGDQIRTMSINNEIEEIEINISGEVQTLDTHGVVKLSRDLVAKETYLLFTKLTEPDASLRRLAKEALAGADEGALDRAHKMMHSISEHIEYLSDSTDSSYTAAQALQQGKGVCQDQAHCLLAIARLNNVPARYVTGYLYDKEKGDNHGESHAWVEMHIDGLGWVGFDAANSCCPDERYVRIGSGLDAQQAALIRGVTRGIGEESMQTNVEVEVSQAQQQ